MKSKHKSAYAKRRAAAAKSLSKNQKLEVKALVKGAAETKRVAYYQGPTTDLSGATGVYSTAQAYGMNQFIESNFTDLLRVIPRVTQGVADTQRIGSTISVSSCKVHMNLSVIVANQANGISQNIFAVVYLLQHVSLKSYQALYSQNDFSQLLELNDGSTDSFRGSFTSRTLPVAKQYYKLLKKKIVPLRSNGFFSGAGGTVMNNNSFQFTHDFTWDVTKHLPKTLKYPEVGSGPATWANDPTNSSIFMAVSYCNMGVPVDPVLPDVQVLQQYTSILGFKDL